MKRTWLVVGTVGVLVAMLLLYWRMSGDDADAGASAPGPTASTRAPTRGSTWGGGALGSAAGALDPAAAGSGVTTLEDGTKVYRVGGYIVRDHRKGDQPIMDIPPNLHPQGSRRLTPELVRTMSDQVRDAIISCETQIPADARGPKPKMQGQIVVGIKDHQVVVKESTVQLRDVVGASIEPVKACMKEKIATVTTAAPDEADLDAYSINLSFAIL